MANKKKDGKKRSRKSKMKKGGTAPKGQNQGMVVRGAQRLQSFSVGLNRGVRDSLAERVCAQVNPFCSAAQGARMTDKFTVPTNTYQARKIIPIITGALGNAGFSFWPSADGYNYTVNVPPTAAWTISASPDFQCDAGWASALTTDVKEARLVTAGCRFWNNLAATVAGGYVETADHGPHAQDGVAVTIGSLKTNFPAIDVCDLRQEFTWISRPVSHMKADFVVPITTVNPTANSTNERWSNFTAAFTGPAGQTIGYVEMVLNYEYIPKGSSALASAYAHRSPNSPSDALVEKAVDQTHAKLPTVQQHAKQAAEKLVKAGAHKVLDSLVHHLEQKVRGAQKAGLAIKDVIEEVD